MRYAAETSELPLEPIDFDGAGTLQGLSATISSRVRSCTS